MIQIPDLLDWLEQVSDPAWTWFAKRLSANDTGLTQSNQVGIYLPKSVGLPLLGETEDPRGLGTTGTATGRFIC